MVLLNCIVLLTRVSVIQSISISEARPNNSNRNRNTLC